MSAVHPAVARDDIIVALELAWTMVKVNKLLCFGLYLYCVFGFVHEQAYMMLCAFCCIGLLMGYIRMLA